MERTALADLIPRLSQAQTLDALPSVVDVWTQPPPNPPESVQRQFVGLSYREAFSEAVSFVAVADEWAARHGLADGLSSARRILDFGAGWGRITRVLAGLCQPTRLYAVDVDPQMTALTGASLPGVNNLCVEPLPPSVLADDSIDVVTAFSVFSHLSPEAHTAWADEFGRLVRPDGLVFITALDDVFLREVADGQEAVRAGTADVFQTRMAGFFDDISATRQMFDDGDVAYAPIGGGGVRTPDFYGWAAVPVPYVQRVWGDAGFDVLEWVPSHHLFPQAMICLRRRTDPDRIMGTPTSSRRAVGTHFGRLRRRRDPQVEGR